MYYALLNDAFTSTYLITEFVKDALQIKELKYNDKTLRNNLNWKFKV